VDPWEVLLTGPHRDVVRVGLAVPLTGPLAMTAPSALDLAGLAADEINTAGGIGGRPVELVRIDSGRAPEAVAAEVATLHRAGVVELLVGFHTSDVHRAVERVLPPGARYVFTPPHEGGARRPGVVRIGQSPLDQHTAALTWLVRHRRARRWVLLGTDYVWPRAVHRAAQRVLTDVGGAVVGKALVPFGPVDPGPLLDLVLRSRADAVLLSLVGRDLVAFNREFARAGLDRTVVRLSGALEENGLYALGGDTTGELYACMPSFAAADESADESQLALQDRHVRRSGPEAPVVCAYARGVYDGVRMAAGLAAGRTPRSRRAAPRLARAEGLTFREPAGTRCA
jgi:ABC-type branched-subunit amino acid transport system substrate-binding protein